MRLRSKKDTVIEASNDGGKTWITLSVTQVAQVTARVSGRFWAFLRAGYTVEKNNTDYRMKRG